MHVLIFCRCTCTRIIHAFIPPCICAMHACAHVCIHHTVTHTYMLAHTHMYTHTPVHMCICIYRERERERERTSHTQTHTDVYVCIRCYTLTRIHVQRFVKCSYCSINIYKHAYVYIYTQFWVPIYPQFQTRPLCFSVPEQQVHLLVSDKPRNPVKAPIQPPRHVLCC